MVLRWTGDGGTGLYSTVQGDVHLEAADTTDNTGALSPD